MEEQLTPLLANTLLNYKSLQYDRDILEKYYQLFDSKRYLGNDFENIYDDIKESYNIDLQSLRYGYNNQNEQKTYADLILAVINETDTKKKIKLIPLIIYLDNDRIFYEYLFEIKYFDDFVYDIKDFFIGTVKDSKVRVNNIEELPPYHQEKEWFENYQQGIKNLNFKHIYSFIEGVERGFGHRFDLLVDFLVFIAYKYFFDDVVKIVNNKNDMFEVMYLIHILNIEETLNLAFKSNNYLLKFESIRKAVYFKSNNNYCLNLLKKERKLLKNIIIQLSKNSYIWQQFLDFYLEYPSRSIQLFEPMSKAIAKINSSSILIMTESIKIDKYFNEDSKEALNSLILNIENNEIKKEILGKLFYRWINYIDNYNEYFGSIILTNIIDIVIVYLRDYSNQEVIERQTIKILNYLDEIDNFWFQSRLEQQNYFYKQMSKLFVYGFALDKYSLDFLKKRIKKICESSFILKKEVQNNSKTTVTLFNKYIFQEGLQC